MSVYYRDRERDRDWDVRSSASHRDSHREHDSRGSVVKKTVYRVGGGDDDDRRSSHAGGTDRRSDRDRGFEETRIVRRVETEPEPEPERREIRIIERSRERERQPEPRRVEREIRYERDYDRDYDRLAPYDRGDLQRYAREVDYFPRPEPPQPIIIRQEPQQIIIQEAPRAPVVVPQPPKEEDFQLVQRSEVGRSARSEVGSERPRRKPQEDEEEDYYYERRVREVSRDNRNDDYEEERFHRRDRDVSPGESVSQVGGGHGRRYGSEDSYDYVRREEYRDGYDSDGSPHHRRHLAEGAIAGLGVAEVLRHHQKKQGEEGSRRGRVGKDVGAAALGAIGAEAVTRARSHYREKSKSRRGSRDRSGDRDGRHRHRRDKSRSRSQSFSRTQKLAGLGLGAAAIAAAAAYARKQNNEKNDRRSRSRTRGHSDGAPEDADDARNPQHRNKKIAQAGLAGAAVAGLVERARSKSRGGRGKSRSKSRLRQGIPIAAAGLGSAAIAGLYERNQAGKKDKEQRREERAARRASRSRSRSQGYDREVPPGDPGLIEYGDQPVYSSNGVADYYGRPASQQGFYGAPEDAMIPAAAAGAAIGAQRERERRTSSSSGSNEGRRRRRHRRRKSDSRSRSRSRGLATAGLAAGAAGLAASQHEKRKQRRKEEKRERKREYIWCRCFRTVELIACRSRSSGAGFIRPRSLQSTAILTRGTGSYISASRGSLSKSALLPSPTRGAILTKPRIPCPSWRHAWRSVWSSGPPRLWLSTPARLHTSSAECLFPSARCESLCRRKQWAKEE